MDAAFDHLSWRWITASVFLIGAGLLFADGRGYLQIPAWVRNVTVVTLGIFALISMWRTLRGMTRG